jgi:hypothetical protein
MLPLFTLVPTVEDKVDLFDFEVIIRKNLRVNC